ncbi:hypothetical protein LRAMOSA09018 [Lichtheimia ramosa]|uniref:Heterokaryon incompatibility domain-containing protein n=1 Tax=Lichtheimia ramosa TaxID=688394 RepID=A0A077WGK2_9FUNG|nr:hypothetical protein LRAMOSA09018 [Lichtheimia ramosa]
MQSPCLFETSLTYNVISKKQDHETYKEESATIVAPEDYEDDLKGVPTLLDDPHFLLLYVPSKDEKNTKMKLVKPATDLYHRQRIMQRVIPDDKTTALPHYALSHLWKTSKFGHQWDDIGHYVDDEDGNPVEPVSMRPEKRDTILALLESHPDSYWWIDVLCARTDTPLDIMGDIYACCSRCYAMIDCDASTIPQIRDYMDRIPDQEGYWSKRLKRIQVNDPQYQPTLDQYKQAVDVLDTFMECDWWKRVWTWQEMVLPREVVFLAETAAHHVSGNHMLDMRLLTRLENNLQTESFRIPGKPLKRTGSTRLMEMKRSREAGEAFRDERISLWTLNHLFKAFERSSRQCMDPLDYVYGVLGVLQFNIPRMADPNQVWHCFFDELEHFITDVKRRSMIDQRDELFAAIGINQDRKDFDLKSAQCMSDVYKGLLDIDMFTVMF